VQPTACHLSEATVYHDTRSGVSLSSVLHLLVLFFLCATLFVLVYPRMLFAGKSESQNGLWSFFSGCSNHDDYTFARYPHFTASSTLTLQSVGTFLWEYLPLEYILPTVAGFWGLPKFANLLQSVLSWIRMCRQIPPQTFYHHPQWLTRPPGIWNTDLTWHARHFRGAYHDPRLEGVYPHSLFQHQLWEPINNHHSFPYQQWHPTY